MGFFGKKKKKVQKPRARSTLEKSPQQRPPQQKPVAPAPPPPVEEPPAPPVEQPVVEPEPVVEETTVPEAPTVPEEDLSPEELKEKQLASLMGLKGVGRKRAEKLWEAGFTSAEEVADATLEELASVEGFSAKLAEALSVDLGAQTFEEDVEADSAMDADVQSEVIAAPAEDTGSEDDVSARLLQWSVDGYDVSDMERTPKDERDAAFIAKYEKTGKAIVEIEDIRDELSEMNVIGLEEEVGTLIDLLSYPNKIGEIVDAFNHLAQAADIRDAKHELEPLAEIDSLAPQVNAVLEKLQAGTLIDDLQSDIADIKRAYKEDFFLSQMADQISQAPAMAVKKAPVLNKNVSAAPEAEKKPMEVEDLFLLHKPSYRLINHLTNRTIGETEKQEVFTELKAVRSFVRHNDKFKVEELNIIKFGDKIALIQQGDNSLITMVVKGDVNVWSKKLIGKVLTMIEKDEGEKLAVWEGDANQLPGAKKNMTALMYACVRLGKQGNGK